jgi:hypothetical protein
MKSLPVGTAGVGAGVYLPGGGGGTGGDFLLKVIVLIMIERVDSLVKVRVFLPFTSFTATGVVCVQKP